MYRPLSENAIPEAMRKALEADPHGVLLVRFLDVDRDTVVDDPTFLEVAEGEIEDALRGRPEVRLYRLNDGGMFGAVDIDRDDDSARITSLGEFIVTIIARIQPRSGMTAAVSTAVGISVDGGPAALSQAEIALHEAEKKIASLSSPDYTGEWVSEVILYEEGMPPASSEN